MESALILCRLLQFASAMLLWGAGSLRAGMFPPILLRDSVSTAATFGRLAAVANLLAALGWLSVEAALVGDGPQDAVNPDVLKAPLTASHFGHVWLVHLALAAGLIVATLRDCPKGVAALAGLNLGSLALTGYAVFPSGPLGVLHQGLSMLHLLAAGFWVGGLVVVVVVLGLVSIFATWSPYADV